jgi:hypothetical protein
VTETARPACCCGRGSTDLDQPQEADSIEDVPVCLAASYRQVQDKAGSGRVHMPDNALDRTLRDIRRHRETIWAAIETATGSSMPDAEDAARLKQRVSFLVRCLHDNPLTRANFGRLVRMRMDFLDQPHVQHQCGEIEKAILRSVNELRRFGQKCDSNLRQRYTREQHNWVYEGLGDQLLTVQQALAALSKQIRGRKLSGVPNGRLSDYGHAALVLVRAEARIKNQSVTIDSTRSRLGVPVLERMLGFDLDYSGHTSAAILASIYIGTCPSDAEALLPGVLNRTVYLVQPGRRGQHMDDTRALREIGSAVDDVCAIMERTLEGVQVRERVLDRTSDYFRLFMRDSVRRAREEEKRSGGRYEEHVFQPKVEELLFMQGFYFVSQPHLRAGERRADLLVRVKDDWLLVELKQVGFDSVPLAKGSANAALRGLHSQLRRYHTLLAGMGGVQHDVFGLVFANGNLSFVTDADIPADRTDWWDKGLHFHVRLVSLPLSSQDERRQVSVPPGPFQKPRG